MQELLETFGVAQLRPGQQKALAALWEGLDVLAVMPTGSGKSLIYQVGACTVEGLTLVVSPLISLMVDQVSRLQGGAVQATYLASSLEPQEKARRVERLKQNHYKLLFVAPERLYSRSFRNLLTQLDIGLLAIDEAHCISQWGHDFRPDYRRLKALRQQLGNPVTVALTATATPDVQEDIVNSLGIPKAVRVVTGFDRSNLSLAVLPCEGESQKQRALVALVKAHPEEALIVYVGTRAQAEEVTALLTDLRPTICYHGGLSAAARSRAQTRFSGETAPVVVATNAFGMGIDRPDIRLVVHYSMPGTLEAYYQEVGRAGRDGELARAVLLYDRDDRRLQDWFILRAFPTLEGLRKAHRSIANGRNLHRLNRVAVAQLEKAGLVVRGRSSHFTALPWRPELLADQLKASETYRAHRRGQLQLMVDFAKSKSCRRLVIVGHFGQQEVEPIAPCCDNCDRLGEKAREKGNGPR